MLIFNLTVASLLCMVFTSPDCQRIEGDQRNSRQVRESSKSCKRVKSIREHVYL